MADWGQGFQGAAGGAAAGGAFGGPFGALVGGGLGLLGGLFGGGGPDISGYQEQLKQLAAGYGKRTAPQGTAQTAAGSQYRQNQGALVAQLEAMARGEGPSAAQNQMREAMDRAAGAQSSAAAGAGGRGVNAGAALRNAANNTAAIQSQGARDSATLRAQEQMSATGQLGGVLQGARGADENLNMFNANAGNEMQRANMQAYLQQLGLNDESQLRALLGAMGGESQRPQGMGTQLLAAGAGAVPGLLQYSMAQKAMGRGGGGNTGVVPPNMFNQDWGPQGGQLPAPPNPSDFANFYGYNPNEPYHQ